MTTQNRVNAGIPTGGQFAAWERPDSYSSLSSEFVEAEQHTVAAARRLSRVSAALISKISFDTHPKATKLIVALRPSGWCASHLVDDEGNTVEKVDGKWPELIENIAFNSLRDSASQEEYLGITDYYESFVDLRLAGVATIPSDEADSTYAVMARELAISKLVEDSPQLGEMLNLDSSGELDLRAARLQVDFRAGSHEISDAVAVTLLAEVGKFYPAANAASLGYPVRKADVWLDLTRAYADPHTRPIDKLAIDMLYTYLLNGPDND